MKYVPKSHPSIECEAIQFPGYLSKEVQDFVGGNYIIEERDGIGACGFFIKTSNGSTKMPSTGDYIIKYDDGSLSCYHPLHFKENFREIGGFEIGIEIVDPTGVVLDKSKMLSSNINKIGRNRMFLLYNNKLIGFLKVIDDGEKVIDIVLEKELGDEQEAQ